MGHKLREKTHILVISALGVVFGDIGTSPLYTVKVCFTGQAGLAPSPPNVLGLMSLIFWSLTLVVSVKYALFIMRADDEGEGGIFAMLALLHKKMGPNLGRGLVLAGLFGSALLYGDGLITPVISVLSAFEGLEVATTQAKPFVLPLTCLVLVLLFSAQSHGTGRLQIFRSGDDSLVCGPRLAGNQGHRDQARDLGCGKSPAGAPIFSPQWSPRIFHPRRCGAVHHRM
jgi:KUP system potassium uptake protein